LAFVPVIPPDAASYAGAPACALVDEASSTPANVDVLSMLLSGASRKRSVGVRRGLEAGGTRLWARVAAANLAAVLRVIADPRVTTALRGLADALEADGLGDARPELAVRAANMVHADLPGLPAEITDEHRRYAQRRLRKAGVLP
jgi:hypothetical protein